MNNTNNLTGQLNIQAVKATELVAYQQGAIVSRELVRNRAGTVTVFAFDAGQSLSEHTAPFVALVYVLEGQAEISISGKPHRLGPGELLLMPANVPHGVKALTKFKMILTMLKA